MDRQKNNKNQWKIEETDGQSKIQKKISIKYTLKQTAISTDIQKDR